MGVLPRQGNLDSKRDWGHAKDYVRMMWMMLQCNLARLFASQHKDSKGFHQSCFSVQTWLWNIHKYPLTSTGWSSCFQVPLSHFDQEMVAMFFWLVISYNRYNPHFTMCIFTMYIYIYYILCAYMYTINPTYISHWSNFADYGASVILTCHRKILPLKKLIVIGKKRSGNSLVLILSF